MLKEEYGVNVPIYIEDLNKAQLDELRALEMSNEIKCFDSNVYYFPKKMSFGDSLLSAYPVIIRRFISNGSDIYGYVSGLSLENLAGISTQIPRMMMITTNNVGENMGVVTVGFSKVRVRRPPTVITNENVTILQFLDLLSSISLDNLDEYEMDKLIEFKEKAGVSRELLEQYSNLYPNSIENVGKLF